MMKRVCVLGLVCVTLLAAGCAVRPPTEAGPPAARPESSAQSLYLVRHGNAKPAAADPERPLTAKGTADVKKIASFLRALGLRVDVVWHSGLTRARETAELLAPAFAGPPPVAEHAGLKPRDPAGPILQDLAAAKKSVVIVGHRPWLAAAAAELLAGGQRSSPIDVAEGAVACLERGADGLWRLRWVITPGLLRRGQGR
ncbi:MAG: phosphohistidine phosphatase SixA [Planctomycetota bacterium]